MRPARCWKSFGNASDEMSLKSGINIYFRERSRDLFFWGGDGLRMGWCGGKNDGQEESYFFWIDFFD